MPGWIDLTENTNITNYGIYQLRTCLTICLHEKHRRTTFEPPPGEALSCWFWSGTLRNRQIFPSLHSPPRTRLPQKSFRGRGKLLHTSHRTWAYAVEEGRIIPYTFEGNNLITVGPGNVRVEIEYRLDPTKSPKQIDQRFTGGTIGPWIARGIYKLEGETLTICYGGPNVARPTEFTAKPGDGRTMRVHKRVE